MKKWWRSQIRSGANVFVVTFSAIAAAVLLVTMVLFATKVLSLNAFMAIVATVSIASLTLELWACWREHKQWWKEPKK
jgi:hypothetical protein